jgi:tRNA threonylcarbamoyladenosine biosynthesis protein TsaB
MILYLKTDSPWCELYLRDNNGEMIDGSWQADRQLAKDLLRRVENLLHEHSALWKDLTGLVVFCGPGSFTGLRIGITVMNTIAYAESLPIVGVQGDEWQHDGEARLRAGENDRVVTPEYGREARITKPRK